MRVKRKKILLVAGLISDAHAMSTVLNNVLIGDRIKMEGQVQSIDVDGTQVTLRVMKYISTEFTAAAGQYITLTAEQREHIVKFNSAVTHPIDAVVCLVERSSGCDPNVVKTSDGNKWNALYLRRYRPATTEEIKAFLVQEGDAKKRNDENKEFDDWLKGMAKLSPAQSLMVIEAATKRLALVAK